MIEEGGKEADLTSHMAMLRLVVTMGYWLYYLQKNDLRDNWSSGSWSVILIWENQTREEGGGGHTQTLNVVWVVW